MWMFMRSSPQLPPFPRQLPGGYTTAFWTSFQGRIQLCGFWPQVYLCCSVILRKDLFVSAEFMDAAHSLPERAECCLLYRFMCTSAAPPDSLNCWKVQYLMRELYLFNSRMCCLYLLLFPVVMSSMFSI